MSFIENKTLDLRESHKSTSCGQRRIDLRLKKGVTLVGCETVALQMSAQFSTLAN